MCALYFYAHQGKKSSIIADQHSDSRVDNDGDSKKLLFAIACSICSVLSKSAALLAAPAGFFALDLLRGTIVIDDFSPQGRQKIFAYIFSTDRVLIAGSTLLLLVITLWANTGGTQNDIDTVTIDIRSRFLKAPILLFKTIRDAAWPAHLSPHYVWKDWLVEPSLSPTSVLSIGSLPATFFIATSAGPMTLAIWLWFVVTSLPTLGLVQHGMVSFGGDRYAYLPLIPLLTYMSILALRLEKCIQDSVMTLHHNKDNGSANSANGNTALRSIQSYASTSTCRSTLLCGGILVYLLSLGWVTHMSVPHWRNDETLWKWAIRTDPTDWRSTDQLVEYYIKKGDWANATPLLLPIELFSPKAGLKAHLHKAKLLVMQGRTDEACTIYAALAEEESFRLSPASGSIYNNNGVCSLHQNDQPSALWWFEEGLKHTTYDRHRQTLDSNMQELKRRWTHDQPQQQRYKGVHSLIF